MVVHGDDSLNERSEEEGLGVEDEPTREQLLATGELDPEEDDEVKEGEEEKEPASEQSPGSALTVPPDTSLSIRKQIERRLMAGESRGDLEAAGFNKRSIQTVASELKGKLRTRTPIGRAPATSSKGMPIFAKGSPPEAIIDTIEVPDVSDGSGFAFEQGIKFGMSLVTIGIRMAQELSGIGIMQAKPLLDMAKSMREGEALAAKNAAGEAAMEAAGLVRENMMPYLASLGKGGGGGTDPMRAMTVRIFEPILQSMLTGTLGRLVPGVGPKQITEGSGQQELDTAGGWIKRDE